MPRGGRCDDYGEPVAPTNGLVDTAIPAMNFLAWHRRNASTTVLSLGKRLLFHYQFGKRRWKTWIAGILPASHVTEVG